MVGASPGRVMQSVGTWLRTETSGPPGSCRPARPFWKLLRLLLSLLLTKRQGSGDKTEDAREGSGVWDTLDSSPRWAITTSGPGPGPQGRPLPTPASAPTCLWLPRLHLRPRGVELLKPCVDSFLPQLPAPEASFTTPTPPSCSWTNLHFAALSQVLIPLRSRAVSLPGWAGWTWGAERSGEEVPSGGHCMDSSMEVNLNKFTSNSAA